MKVTIHQPEHMPWLGFFHKMAQADVYVLLDTVQFEKNNYQNRNQFVDKQGKVFWQTVPVNMKGHLESTIRDITVDPQQPWQRKYWARLADVYGKHKYFPKYAPELEPIFKAPLTRLFDINLRLIEFFRRALGIDNKIIMASTLNVEGKRSELLLNICLATGAKTYLSGPSGKDYLDLPLFAAKGVGVEYHHFEHPVYESKFFHKQLSTMDLVMNHGENSAAILGISR